jgi:hypothetical protein
MIGCRLILRLSISYRDHVFVFPHSSIQIRGIIIVNISVCHTEDPGSVPGRGVFRVFKRLGRLGWQLP